MAFKDLGDMPVTGPWPKEPEKFCESETKPQSAVAIPVAEDSRQGESIVRSWGRMAGAILLAFGRRVLRALFRW